MVEMPKRGERRLPTGKPVLVRLKTFVTLRLKVSLNRFSADPPPKSGLTLTDPSAAASPLPALCRRP